MDIKLHKQATTTPKIRAEIQAAPAHIPDTVLAERFGVSDMIIRRWRIETKSMILLTRVITSWPPSTESRKKCSSPIERSFARAG